MKHIPIFIVNLKRDTEKKEHMLELCKKNALKCQFIDAVYGHDLEENYVEQVTDREKSMREYGQELSRGEIGCTLSHVSIYKQMIEQNIENAVIFEDDIHLGEGFSTVINSIDTFPKDWEVMLLGYYSNVFTEMETKASFMYKNKVSGPYESVRLVQLSYGTHGYMINIKGAKKLVKELTEIIKPIDHYTGVDTYVNMYAIRPRVVMLDDKFKDMSGIALERDEKKSQKQLDVKVKILKKMGLIHAAMYTKVTFNRMKKQKEYK